MIKAVVLDVDGVIVGTKHGENFPMPSAKVSAMLRLVVKSGTPVSFCSAKSAFAVAETIKHVGLDAVHIADAGAVLYNPIQEKVLFEKAIPKHELRFMVDLLLKNNTYVMLFSPTTYFLLGHTQSDFTRTYTHHIGKDPHMVSDFTSVIDTTDIVKIIAFTFDEATREALRATMKSHASRISYAWAGAPIFDPAVSLVITAHGISKRSGLKELAHLQHVSVEQILGVGDTVQDWDFLEICGYKATLANATEELKQKFDFSHKHQYMGAHVNEDGLIEIFKHFQLI